MRVALGSERTVQLGDQYVRIEFLSIESAIGSEKNVNLDARMQRREEPVPTTVNGGRAKSSTAVPSRRNSGLLSTIFRAGDTTRGRWTSMAAARLL